MRGTTLGLTGSRDADGAVVEHHTDGHRVPVEVVALDPDAYAATPPEAEVAGRFALLRPGTVLLTETAAALRGVGTGARLDIGDVSDLAVVGIVPDDTAGRAEIVVHEHDADALGLDDDGTVFIRHDAAPGAPTEALVTAIEERIPADLTAR